MKRKRVKQESSEADFGLDDQDDEKIGHAAFGHAAFYDDDDDDEDNDDPMVDYQYPGPTLSKLKPVKKAKKAKIAKCTQANIDAFFTTTNEDADTDIGG